MRFGVLGCPKCRRIQAVELRHRTVSCRACRAHLDTTTARWHYRGDDELEARNVVLRVSAQMQGMGIEDLGNMLATVERERPQGSIDDVVSSLPTDREFSADEFADLMQRHRVRGNPEAALANLAADNRVYEPRAGRYRVT